MHGRLVVGRPRGPHRSARCSATRACSAATSRWCDSSAGSRPEAPVTLRLDDLEVLGDRARRHRPPAREPARRVGRHLGAQRRRHPSSPRPPAHSDSRCGARAGRARGRAGGATSAPPAHHDAPPPAQTSGDRRRVRPSRSARRSRSSGTAPSPAARGRGLDSRHRRSTMLSQCPFVRFCRVALVAPAPSSSLLPSCGSEPRCVQR